MQSLKHGRKLMGSLPSPGGFVFGMGLEQASSSQFTSVALYFVICMAQVDWLHHRTRGRQLETTSASIHSTMTMTGHKAFFITNPLSQCFSNVF